MGYLLALLVVIWAAVTYWPVAVAVALGVGAWWFWRGRQGAAALQAEREEVARFRALTERSPLLIPSRDAAVVQVVGESHRQDALARIGGSRTTDGVTNREHVAALVHEASNPADQNAVAVRLDGERVGYLAREVAPSYLPAVKLAESRARLLTCRARLTGGWVRAGEVASIGVLLNLGSPAETLIDLVGAELEVRTDHPWPGSMIAFTGDSRFALAGVPLDRSATELLARRAGLHVHPRVTKAVKVLVDCDPASESGNELKAIQYGIAVVPEPEFWRALGVPAEPIDQWGRRPEWQRMS